MTAMAEPLIPVAEVARRLGLGTTATRSLIASGSLVSLRVGPGSRSIRCRPEDIEAWIESRIEGGCAEGAPGALLRVHRELSG